MAPHRSREGAMVSNPNVTTLVGLYARWGATKGGNVDEVLDLLDDEVEMRSVLSPDLPVPIAGTHRSKAGARDYFTALLREWEMVDWQCHRFIADGDDVVMVGRCHWRSRETGAEVDSQKVDVWHFENGKATRFLEMFDSLAFATAVGAAQMV
jgi:ketosteroid isomerase-like protein